MSVRKRTWTTGKGVEKTAWVVDYVDTKGKRRLKSFKLKKDADAFAATASVEVREGIHVADRDTVTVAKAGAFWIATGEGEGLERSTINQRKRHLKYHIAPFIGDTLLSKVDPRAFQDTLRAEGRSPAMVKKALSSLGSIFAEARTISIHQRADEFGEIGRPKSEAGERTIPVPPMVINALKEWKLGYSRPVIGRDDDGKPISEDARPSHLIFANGAGKVESHANIVNRGLIPAMIAAGVTVDTGKRDEEGRAVVAAKYTGLHALRHFYASWLINRREDGGLGLPLKVVQERMGHSSITMTADTYGHLFPRADHADELAVAEAALLA